MSLGSENKMVTKFWLPKQRLPVVGTIALILVLYLAMASRNITAPPFDLHQFRQTQTASTIYNYYLKGVDLLRPELDSNGGDSVIVLEFPIYQAVVAKLAHFFGYSDIIGRVLNILLTLLTAAILYYVGRVAQLQRAGLLSAAAFLLLPSNIFWSRTILIDPLAVCCGALFAFLRLRQNLTDRDSGFKYLFASSLALALGLLIKAPTIFAFVVFDIALTGMMFLRELPVTEKKRQLFLGVLRQGLCSYLPAITIFVVWRLYCAKMHEANPHSYSAAGLEWYMGALSQRTDAWSWRQFGSRFIWNHAGIVLIPALILAAITVGRRRVQDAKSIRNTIPVAVASLVAVLAYIVVFFNANLIHTYYQLPLNCFIGILFGITTDLVIGHNCSWYRDVLSAWLLILGLTTVAISTLYRGGWQDIQAVNNPFTPLSLEYKAAKFASKFIPESPSTRDKELVYVVETSPVFSGPHSLLYYLRRRGRVELQTGSLESRNVGAEFKTAIFVGDKRISAPLGLKKLGCRGLTNESKKWFVCVFGR
jgi:4-amino-4-deoxy-L-arabinose transferase-like glycosyltransferase